MLVSVASAGASPIEEDKGDYEEEDDNEKLELK